MENNSQTEAVEKTLVDQLSKSSLSKDQLSKISRTISALQKAGFRIHDWFPNGQPGIDKIVIDAQLAVENSSALAQALTLKNLKEINLLRKGIPVPIFYQVKAIIEER